ncbi:hypothetical protein LTR20_006062 [Exophiala xenobiotica]|nr:hypothetical protein LTS13_002970 [Exophiala xenobiotica]KAK5395965.1 hypothetical protein LTR79_006719 [Exophiala xenobiotica]KAK5423918.1 hypothetical protein LTR90_001264 [Exophiala xenobiotica]KAK5462113.1 hypothetical protein LTR20_006062 [Exophiala xenobiotica]KAK5479720.1 hypothetical protein LTR26_007573 [Exophiala xenobiotica]
MAGTQPDIAVQITVPNDTNPSAAPLLSAERRITPSWTISQLKSKLEPVTGIPASAQSLRTRSLDGTFVHLSDESSLVGDARYGLHRGSEIEIIDARPAGMRQSFNFADLSSVEKYQMPESQYEKLDDSVLAWKKRAKLGRFDPSVSQKTAEEMAEERKRADREVIERRRIDVGMRCRVGRDDARRGVVRFVGEIGGLGGARESGCVWIGVELDEPVGRNDGSVLVEIAAAAAADDDENGEGDDEEEEGKGEERQAGGGKKEEKMVRVFECRDKFGVFVRPEKVEVGEQWSMLGLDDLEDEDMEEV